MSGKYRINPVKATCMKYEGKDNTSHIQGENETCFGICAAFSGTYDTYNMDPQCIQECTDFIDRRRREVYGVGSCDHQQPYRPVYWGEVPRFVPKLIKKGLAPELARQKCMDMCQNVNLNLECQENCQLDYNAIEIPEDNSTEQDSTEQAVMNKPVGVYSSATEQGDNNQTKVIRIIGAAMFILFVILVCFKLSKGK